MDKGGKKMNEMEDYKDGTVKMVVVFKWYKLAKDDKNVEIVTKYKELFEILNKMRREGLVDVKMYGKKEVTKTEYGEVSFKDIMEVIER